MQLFNRIRHVAPIASSSSSGGGGSERASNVGTRLIISVYLLIGGWRGLVVAVQELGGVRGGAAS